MCVLMDTHLGRCQYHYLEAYKMSDFLELDSAHLFPEQVTLLQEKKRKGKMYFTIGSPAPTI